MSEYWVSRKKYFCKYCDIYIADDAPSRQQHENGFRHKGNKDRFIRGLYKAGEKRQKDLAEERRDMARIEQAAQAAFAQDVGAGLAKLPTAPVASTSTAHNKPTPKASNPFTNYSTAQSLGYDDPDAERLALEAEYRRSQGVAGQWELLPPSTAAVVDQEEEMNAGDGSTSGVKRGAGAPPVVDEEDTREFRLKKRKMNYGFDDLYDPGVIAIKVKKKEEGDEGSSASGAFTNYPGAPKATETPVWTTTQWKRPGQAPSSEPTLPSKVVDGVKTPIVKPEEAECTLTDVGGQEQNKAVVNVKSEEAALPTKTEGVGSMFRKRKAPVKAGGRRP